MSCPPPEFHTEILILDSYKLFKRVKTAKRVRTFETEDDADWGMRDQESTHAKKDASTWVLITGYCIY